MKHIFRLGALVAALALSGFAAQAQETDVTNRLYQGISSGGPAGESISIVRETALREVSLTVGAQAGLKDRSCEIAKSIDKNSAAMDQNYRFNSLMMGAGLLPPVISQAADTVAVTRNVLRVGKIAYHFDEPAMLVDTPPTWRNWLYVGLDTSQCGKPSEVPALAAQMRPQNDAERKFVKTELEKAYAAGRQQAQSIFDLNLAKLERTHRGMKRYFELYERGIVFAPEIVSSTDILSMEDANTMVIGNTVIRISREAGFVTRDDQWKPLAP